MSIWPDYQFHQLVELPRPDDGLPGALIAALGGAHPALLGAGGELCAVWLRAPGERQLRFLVGGRPGFPPSLFSDRPGRRQVLFPPGAVAADLSATEAAGLLDRFDAWVPCAVRPDALWEPARRGGFDRHVAHLDAPFAWLVLAEPLAPQVVQPELDLLVNQILPLTRGEVGEARRIRLERLQARHRELSRAQAGDCWRVSVLVGGSPSRVATLAAGLCAVTELDGLPYVVAPAGPGTGISAARAYEAPVATTEVLAALARPPARELPGLRLVEPHTFDVTPEGSPADFELSLGAVLDQASLPSSPLTLDRDTLNRHTFVCGATGSGKSQTVRHMLTEAARIGLPWLAVEPAKAEYARMAARLAPYGRDVIVIRPGDPAQPPAGFNPLEPEPGFPLQTHLDLLRALFLAVFQSAEPFPQVIATALTRGYEELGWDLALGEPVPRDRPPRYPTLGDLQRIAASVVTDIGYGAEASADVSGFIKVRLASLRLGTTGRFFEGGHRLDFRLLRERNVVLEIENVGDDADKAFLMGAVLIRLSEHLRVRSKRHGGAQLPLSHLTVIEEAHRLLRRASDGASGPAQHAVELFAGMLAEVRAHGEGLIIAEQIPGKLIPDVIKNTAVKIVHRLPARDDRAAVGATMNLDEQQSRHVVSLRPGTAAVFTDGMDRPLLVRMPDGTGSEEGPLAAAGVDAIVSPRSETCGLDCRSAVCTLRQMREAQHLLAERPWLALWAELTVLAHLVGQRPPVPDPSLVRSLAGLDARLLDCALGHAVDDAVAVRSGQLHPQVSATGLALHCVTVMRAVVGGASDLCASDGFAYLADHLRWLRVFVELALGIAAESSPAAGSGPDPATGEWETWLRRRIPGRTRVEQHTAVAGWWQAALADQRRLDAIGLGTRRPSTVEAVVGGTPADEAWDGRLAEAIDGFSECGFATQFLVPQARRRRAAEARAG